jgi:hypothetical protein
MRREAGWSLRMRIKAMTAVGTEPRRNQWTLDTPLMKKARPSQLARGHVRRRAKRTTASARSGIQPAET